MNDTAMLVLAIVTAIITWTASVISMFLWLTNRFRNLEKIFFHELMKHQHEDERMFRLHGTKIQRLEIKAFGFTGPLFENGIDGNGSGGDLS